MDDYCIPPEQSQIGAMAAPTWIYHPADGARMVDMPEGEKPPRGWHDTPAKFQAPAPEPVPNENP